MTVIQVNPDLLNIYGAEAGEIYGTMITKLDGIVTAVNSLTYAGGNAKEFKDACGEMVLNYVQFMNTNLTGMSKAIVEQCQKVEGSLGGRKINVHVEEVNCSTAIDDASADTVILDLDQLAQTQSQIQTYFGELSQLVDDHKSSFDRAKAEWQGESAEIALDAVINTTTVVVSETERIGKEVTKAMTNQNDIAVQADSGSAA